MVDSWLLLLFWNVWIVVGCWLVVVGHCSLTIGCWLLFVGPRFVVGFGVGRWMLVVGYWLLVV